MFRLRAHYLSPDAPAGGQPAPAVPPVSPERRTDQFLDRLLARHGSAESALRALTAELFTAQDTAATLTTQLADARAKLPGDGAVVLPKAEAESYAKLVALKLTPDQIVEAVQHGKQAQEALAQREAEQAYRTAATAAGIDPEAFAAHAAREQLQVEMRDAAVTEKGKTVTKKLPFVRKAGDDKAPYVAVAEYTGTLPAHEQRALQATAPVPAPTPYPSQQPTPTGAAAESDRTAAFIAKQQERAKARPHPLIPARPVQQPAGATP